MKNSNIDKPVLSTAEYIVSQTQMSLDLKMVTYDIWGTIAHVLMLHEQKIINTKNTAIILKALKEIEQEAATGKFAIDPKKGAQLTLEAKIVEKVGDIGYSVHTGRSRNDQVMVTEMLYLKEEVLHLMDNMLQVLKTLHLLSEKHINTIMPGYTHMQPAKLTTFGQWALAYLNGFLRTISTMKHYFHEYNINPLGACESYGTSWPLDREFTTSLLGFSNVWEIPQDVISSRGFPQLGYLTALSETCLVASKVAQDLLLFDTYEYGMVGLGEEVAQRMHPITGSSVMAQKKNPDALELIRSTSPQLSGFVLIVNNILNGLPMGYNRDSREVKEYIDLGLRKTKSMLKTLEKVLSTLKVDKERMKNLVTANYSLTTDLADYVAQQSGIGYRLIYKIVGQVVDTTINNGKLLSDIRAQEIIEKAKSFHISLQLTDQELEKAIALLPAVQKRQHVGGSSNKTMKISLKNALTEIQNVTDWVKEQSQTINEAKKKTDMLVSNFISH